MLRAMVRSSAWCPHCAAARNLLIQRKLDFDKIDTIGPRILDERSTNVVVRTLYPGYS
ncbi:uncharacterized protein METZ01_LOCUS229362 [marine metagenome]|uniref:Glutaredoxin domain-containing protein n=1 Tax=marine metagenome TaxID=408172 RepID=A0A382GN09_9ZZZZ